MRQTSSTEHQVWLVVQDAALSKRFYTEVLGLIPSQNHDGDGWTCPIPDGRRLVVQHSGTSRRNSSQSALTIELPTADAVIASHILARISGGAACSPIRVGGRWTATLIDPDGHVVRVTEMNRAQAAFAPRARGTRRPNAGAVRIRPAG